MSNPKNLLFVPLMLAFLTLNQSGSRAQSQSADAKSKPAGSISGHVTIGDKSAPGILVVAGGGPFMSQGVSAQATSDADGNYRIVGLAPGQVSVTPVAPVYVLPPTPMVSQGRTINLSPGESVEGVDFKLTRGGVITGRVTDADGRPVIEERVDLVQVDEKGTPARVLYSRPANFQMYQTDDRGVYRVYGLAAGRYKVSVGAQAGMSAVIRSSGYYQKTFYPDVTDESKASIVDLNEGSEAKNIDITLGRRSATYTVSGRIVDADTGQPLPGIPYAFGVFQKNQTSTQTQSYIAGTASPGTPTNSQGEFRLEGVEPGRYAVFVSSSMIPNAYSGAKVFSEPLVFEVINSDLTDLEIKAQRGLTIGGSVVFEQEVTNNILAKLSRLVIYANVEPGASEIRILPSEVSSRINADSSFLIEGLRPGRVTLNVGAFSAPESLGFTTSRIEYNGAVQNRGLELAPGQSISGVRIYLAYGTGVVRGQVKVEGGTLPSDAVIFVAATRAGQQNRASSQVDSRGRFVIKGLAPGTYEIQLQIISFGYPNPLPRGIPRVQRETVTVADDAEAEVLFTLDLNRKDGP